MSDNLNYTSQEGWHLPTDKEWMNLEENTGMFPSWLELQGWRETNKKFYHISVIGWYWTAQNSLRNLPGIELSTMHMKGYIEVPGTKQEVYQ